MIAENKQEFFEQLQKELQKLGVEDTKELMSDLEEHFAEGERRGVAESEICRELGSIAEIARSCLDLKSTAINSMVARDVERKKGVSLTKPGRSVPADPSLAAQEKEPTDVPSSESAEGVLTENAAEMPSYTPEHISSEIFPNAARNTASPSGADDGAEGGSNSDLPGAGDSGSENANVTGGGSESVNSGTTDGAANAEASDNGSATGGFASANGGMFEKVGKAVDIACDKAGKALNDALGKAGSAVNGAFNKAGSAVNSAFRPSDSYRKNISGSKHGGDIPPQYTKVKGKGGGKFIDTSGLQPNVNGGRLLCEILLDVFLWSWLIIVVFSLVAVAFGGALSLIGSGVACILAKFDFAQYKFITRILFSLGFWNAAAAVFCLAGASVKAAASLVKHVISRHIKAIYDI